MIKAVIFDLWDTLIYLPEGWQTFNFLRELYKIESSYWRNTIKPLFLCRKHETEFAFIRDFQQHVSIYPYTEEFLVEQMQKIRINDVNQIKLFDDALPILDSVSQHGMKTAIISNQASFYEGFYWQSTMSEKIDVTVFSNHMGFRKPDKAIYYQCLSMLEIEPNECLMIGDNKVNDYTTPLSLGMHAIHLSRSAKKPQANAMKSLYGLLKFLY